MRFFRLPHNYTKRVDLSSLWYALILVVTSVIVASFVATTTIEKEAEPLLALHADEKKYRRSVMDSNAAAPLAAMPTVKGVTGVSSSQMMKQVQSIENAVSAAYEQGSCRYADSVVWDSPTAYWRFSTYVADGGDVSDTVGKNTARAKLGVLFGMPSAVGCLDDFSIGLLSVRETFVAVRVKDTFLSKKKTMSSSSSDSTPFAVELWARPMALSKKHHQVVISASSNDRTRGFAIVLDESDSQGTWIAQCYTAEGKTSIKGGVSNLGTWYHLVISFDGENMRFGINGMSSVTFAQCLAPRGKDLLYIGAAGLKGPFFQGDIDEVAIYNSALPWDRIEAHRRSARPPLLKRKSSNRKKSAKERQKGRKTRLGEEIADRRRPPDLDGKLRGRIPRRKD